MLLLMDLSFCQPSHKNWSSIPHNLKHLSRWQLRNITLHISISMISSPSIQSTHNPNNKHPGKIEPSPKQHSTECIHLSSSDIGLMFIMNPILIEPIINLSFKINMVAKVSWSGRCGEELSFFRHQVGPIEFDVGSTIVF